MQDRFFRDVVQPYTWIAAVLLFLSYIIGLWFTLRTHAAIIWTSEHDEKKPVSLQHHGNSSLSLHGQHADTQQSTDKRHVGQGHKHSMRESKLYARILGQSLAQVGLKSRDNDENYQRSDLHLVPPKNDGNVRSPTLALPGLSKEQNDALIRQVAEVAATVATVAARDATRKKGPNPATVSGSNNHSRRHTGGSTHGQADEVDATAVITDQQHAPSSGGHDAPNWSRAKSSVILLVATFAYAIIAEILVSKVDVVLKNVDIDEKFLGATLFALVPNTTEFLVSDHPSGKQPKIACADNW